jgi:hypothetical protein
VAGNGLEEDLGYLRPYQRAAMRRPNRKFNIFEIFDILLASVPESLLKLDPSLAANMT